MINFNQIVKPLEQTIVQWVADYPLHIKVHQLQDLTNAEFLIFMLKRIKHFNFTEQIKFTHFEGLSLGEKIARMKIVGHSIIRYYRQELLIDMNDISFNYIDMCLQNKEELIRMFIMFIGIVSRNEEIKNQINNFTLLTNQENCDFLNIMMQYANKIGEGEQIQSDSPIKKQKRLITRLEILQEQIQFYQDYTHQLEGKIELIQDENIKQKRKINEIQQIQKLMIKKVQDLQNVNDDLQKQLQVKEQKEQYLNAKLVNSRQVADELISKLIKDVEKQREESYYYKNQLCKYQNLEIENKELQKINGELKSIVDELQQKLIKNGQILNVQEQTIKQLRQQNQKLLLQNQKIQLKLQLFQKSLLQYENHHYSPQQRSITEHDHLSRSFGESQNPIDFFNYQTRLQQINQRRDMNDSLTLTIKSNQSQYIEQGKSMKITKSNASKNKQNINQFNIIPEPNNNIKNYLSQINQQKSMQLNLEQIQQLMKQKQYGKLSTDLLIQIILDIYNSNEYLRKQLRKIEAKNQTEKDRKNMFRDKVNKMFG